LVAECDEVEADDDGDRRYLEGRAAILRVVELTVEASQRPKPIHGVQDQPSAIRFRFLAQPGDHEESDDEEEN
jgi:hypothetical protein